MVVPEEDGSRQDRARAQAQREKQNTLTSVLEKACDAYKRGLKESPRAIDVSQGPRPVRRSGQAVRAWAMPRKAGAAWPASSPQHTDPLLVESGLVHPSRRRKTVPTRNATTASATASCSPSATSRASA